MTAAGGAHTAFVHRGRQNQHRMKVTFRRFNVSILSIDHYEKTRSTQDSEPSRLSVTRRFTSVPTLVVSCSFYRLKQSLRWRTRDWRTRTELWSGSSPNCPSEMGRTRREEKRREERRTPEVCACVLATFTISSERMYVHSFPVHLGNLTFFALSSVTFSGMNTQGWWHQLWKPPCTVLDLQY